VKGDHVELGHLDAPRTTHSTHHIRSDRDRRRCPRSQTMTTTLNPPRVLVKEAARVAVLAGTRKRPGRPRAPRDVLLEDVLHASVTRPRSPSAPMARSRSAMKPGDPLTLFGPGDHVACSRSHELDEKSYHLPGRISFHQRPGVVDLWSVSRISELWTATPRFSLSSNQKLPPREWNVAVEDEPMISRPC